jgi:hypothetical protein
MAFCIQCGATIADDDKFCLGCGAAQDASAPSGEQKETAPVSTTETAAVATAEEGDTKVEGTQQEEKPATPAEAVKTETTTKPKKKKRLSFKLILVLLVLACLGAGGGYAYYDYWQQSDEDETFVDYWIGKAGLEKVFEDWLGFKSKDEVDTDTSKQDETTDDTSTDDTTGDDTTIDDTTTDDTITQDKSYWFDENGDIVDKDDKQYFLVDEDRELYYNPADKKIYTPTATVMKVKSVSNLTVYYNEKFSFMIVFPRGWEKYKVVEDSWKLNSGKKAYSYTFTLPTVGDPTNYIDAGPVPMFAIEVFEKADYTAILKDPDEIYPPIALGINGKYGYGYIYPDGVFPDDVLARVQEVEDIMTANFSFHTVNP